MTAHLKMMRTQNQASKTGLATSGQDPNFDEDHPLGSTAAVHSPGISRAVQAPPYLTEDLAPGLQARSKTRTPPFEGPETVDELDEDKQRSTR